ncbi:MAG: Hsp70 protein that interacts with Zuo1p [Chrysothrix sp. TS-e1954]|nr:MAG: Hsp70 protein that interacts with Zuo1p [Chrysothrix sp. TS-e1954]
MSSDEDTSAGRVAIGISFGNSYSSIACTQGGDAKVLANEEGDRQIPSILSYVDGEEFHGAQAKVQLVRNADNTCAGFRDFLGKGFHSIDPTPSHLSAHPKDHNSTIAFSLNDTPSASEPSTVTVSEITTRHLQRLANSASDYLGKRVTSAVLTVPTSFTEAQKDALTACAKDAGLDILQLIHEPTAALLAADSRSASHDKPQDKTVLVADFGSSRSDVAIISVRGGMYTTLATLHDYSLGGTQLDEVLMEHLAKEFLKKHKSATDPRKDKRGAAKLRLESENTKKALSIGASANFNVESLSDGIDFSMPVNRTRYELLAGKTFTRFTRLVQDAVAKASLDVLDIDEVLLVGGTAHTPRIATNIKGVFPGVKVIAPSTHPDSVHPNELIARGAALQAYLIEGFESEDIEQSTHPAVTVTPHLSQTVGIVVSNPPKADASEPTIFRPLIPAETPLPVRRTLTFMNSNSTNPTDLLLRLCEGTRELKITKPTPKPTTNGASKNADNSDSDVDSEEEEEDTRELVWKAGNALGELAIRDVKKGARVTVQVSITAELEVTVSAMEQGKAGVRGVLEAQEKAMNGSAK